MRSRIRDICGLRVCLGALACAALGFAGAATAGALGLVITGGPSGTITSNSATFTFQTKYPAAFTCSLTGWPTTTCGTGTTGTAPYSSLTNAAYDFTVIATYTNFRPSAVAVPLAVTDSATQSFTVAVPPTTRTTTTTTTPTVAPNTVFTRTPSRSTTSTSAMFDFVSVPRGARFNCSLDGGRYTECSSGMPYTGLTRRRHMFRVFAWTAAAEDRSPAEFRWSVRFPVPDTIIVSQQHNSRSRSALIAFKSVPGGAAFQCSVDGRAFKPCASPRRLTRLRPGDHRFSVRAHNEAGIDASPAAVAWRITTPHHWIPVVAGGAGGGLGLLLVVGLGFGMQRRRFRARMQLHASDEEPTGRCEGRGWRCHKELSLKPGRRQIAHVNAAACQSAHELGDDIVWTLNDAVDTYRHSHDRTEEMRLVLLPIAREILQDIDEWLEGERGGTGDCDAVQIELAAHLEGGKAECVLTPYRCTKGNWRKRQPWKIEVADEHDEPIATVLRPGTTAALLVGHLAAFVAQVDVAEPRVPEVAVVPHG